MCTHNLLTNLWQAFVVQWQTMFNWVIPTKKSTSKLSIDSFFFASKSINKIDFFSVAVIAQTLLYMLYFEKEKEIQVKMILNLFDIFFCKLQ